MILASTWEIVEPNQIAHNGFLLLELLELAWKRRAIDVVRKALNNKQERFERTMLSLSDDFHRKAPDKMVNVEEEVANSMLIRQMLEEESLTDEERHFLQLLSTDADAPLRELARLMGYSHYVQAQRTLE
jgi:biotin synthase-related radical SAM superfamily protein